jgi:spermidine/putrescine ABC transporter ATP-binding subunit
VSGPRLSPMALSEPAGDSPEIRPESPAGASVEVERLDCHFGPVHAVREVGFEVRPGEFVALLGPSGSGKTTILKTIAGFEQPTGGDVRIDGRPVLRLPPYRRPIGMVFQNYALFPHLTVEGNVEFPLRMRRIPRAQRSRMVRDALAIVQLEGYQARRPSQLSGGQQQRVALARAIVYRPPLLLMDEPLGALDKKLREQMQLELRRIQRTLGTTVISVTHDQSEALTMADRIAVLSDGALQQIGAPRQVYEEPLNAFVADFIGETNFFRGDVDAVGAGGTVWVRRPDGSSLEAILVSERAVVGMPVRVAVRPERISLNDTGYGGQGPAATIVEAVYEGGSMLYVLDLDSGEAAQVRLHGDAAARSYSAGHRVRLGWHARDARAYPVRET